MGRVIISKPGIPVSIAQPKDLVFDSTFNNMKVALELKGTHSTTLTTLSHGLGSVPVTIGYIKYSNAWYCLPSTVGSTTQFVCDADENNIYIRSSATLAVTYRIFVFFDGIR